LSSSAFFVDRETKYASEMIEKYNIEKKDRMIYLVDHTDKNKPKICAISLKNRIAENFHYEDIKLDLSNSIEIQNLSNARWDIFKKKYLDEPVSNKPRKLTPEEIEAKKKDGEWKKIERLAKKVDSK
jgi:hypothetical protein